MDKYREFLERKILITPTFGFDPLPLSDILLPHQKDIVTWCLQGGRRAIFCKFGLGKTAMQLEIAAHVCYHTNKPFLIGIPLGVKQEFKDDAETLFGFEVKYVKDMSEVDGPGIYTSNYERIRSGKFEPSAFGGVSFDEGDAIRNLATETTDYIMNNFSQVPYRFIATATPSPNDFTEILNYAQFLGVMDRSQALTRFFQRNSTTAGDLTIYPHKEKEFWMWVRSWSVIVEKPSDLGYSDEGYDLPGFIVKYHEVKVNDRGVITDRDGNVKMFRDTSSGLVEACKEKRESIHARAQKAMDIISENPDDHYILWHTLEDERKLMQSLLPEARPVYGTQNDDEKEDNVIGFKKGEFKYLLTKPEISGSGCNFQAHCHKAIFVGIDYRFKDFIQAIHRIYRFRQTQPVEIHIIYSDAEHHVLKTLEEKWSRHKKMSQEMTTLIREFGLSNTKYSEELKRSIGVNRKEASGEKYKAIHNDSVLEVRGMPDNSIGMIMTSIPFSDQYEYCESYHDMGHNDGDEEFFEQLDYLTPELLRVLKPGRVACIHVKDRIRFSYQNGVGFTSLNDFSGRTVAHFEKHGWYLLGKHFITTDVVMENNQTYRLGWTEQCKDGTKMGAGSPEYLLVFRKRPTDISNAYADEPVVKSKEDYTRARWQLDAHAYWKSSGDRLFNPEELRGMNLSEVGKIWKTRDTSEVHSHEKHVEVCEQLDKVGKLPSRFMAIPPRTTNEWVWDDINRMNTLNTRQANQKKEKHVCPLQFDIIDRAIRRYTNEGDVVLDPFGGVMSTPFRAIHLNRYGIGIELNEQYWSDGIFYCKEAEYKKSVPTLFNI
jgi:DNA modification methylase